MSNDHQSSKKLVEDTGGGCSVCGNLPVVNVSGTYWLCGPCVAERITHETADDAEEYARVRGLNDQRIVEEGLDAPDRITRELANRYDVVCEKLRTAEKASETPQHDFRGPTVACRCGWFGHPNALVGLKCPKCSAEFK